MSLDLRTKLAELVPESSCVYNALDYIIESCTVPEDVAERTKLGVRLSICEFAAAGVAYPPICEDSQAFKTCTSLLESKPTWWTTFSGNYRHISTICSELQPQFHTRQALAVYGNASLLFGKYQEMLATEMRAEQELHRQEVKRLHDQVSEVFRQLRTVSIELQSFQTDLAFSHQTNNATMNEMKVSIIMALHELQLFTDSLAVAHDSGMELERRHRLLSHELANMAKSANEVRLGQQDSLMELKSVVGATSISLKADTAALRNAVDGIKGLLWVLRLVGDMLSSVTTTTCVVLLSLFLWWLRPSPQPDLAFY